MTTTEAVNAALLQRIRDLEDQVYFLELDLSTSEQQRVAAAAEIAALKAQLAKTVAP